MITVKKNAIRYKDSDGTMKDSGVLCQLGTVGVNLVKMMSRWTSIFYGVSFSEETHLVLEYGDNFKGEMQTTFAYTGSSNIKSIKIIGNQAVTATMNGTFQNCSAELIDLSECNLVLSTAAMQTTFQGCYFLKEIKGTLDVSQISSFVGTFNDCNALEEIRFLKKNIYKSTHFNQSSLLSDASIQSIIDGLADLTDGDAQTLGFHVDVKVKLTENQIAQITSKNWTLA